MSAALKVGVFTLLVLVVLGVLIIRAEDLNPFAAPGQRFHAVFDSVAGLDNKASVRIAGVRIGRVDGIGLDGQRAKVTLLLDDGVVLPAGTEAAIRNMGLLGDKYVELLLGPAGGTALAVGAVLPGSTPPTFDDAMAKLDQVATSIQDVTGSLSEGDAGSRLSEMLANMADLSATLRDLVAENRRQVTATVSNFESASATLARELPRLADQLQGMLVEIRGVVADNKDNLKGSLANVAQLTERIQVSVDNLNTITDRLAKGEGSIGKLLTSDEAHDQLVKTLDSVSSGVSQLSDTLGRAQKLRLDLNLEGAYLSEVEDSRTAFGVRLDPGSDKFYLIEAVDDPRGRVRTKTEVITTTKPDGTEETTTTRRVTTEDRITISAQFGFELSDRARLRAGLIESTGGAGLDYGLLDRRLWLSFEAFDFGRDGNLDPRLRLRGRYDVHSNVYLLGGVDDLLESDHRSLFLGGGVTWNDDDLKYLLGSLPIGGLN